jgi:two-component system phosphate regulon sensor histidine kinase PhoR
MGILGFYLVDLVRDTQINNLRSQLENEAKLTAEASVPSFWDVEKQGILDDLVKTLGEQIDARVTIIALDGTVLGDSEEDPLAMGNHAARPEVVDALALGLGESTRYSTTLGQRMMYVAVPITSQGGVVGIARVALPLTVVESSVNRVAMTIVLSMVITTVLAILAAGLIARATTQPIRQMTKAAQRIASGELDQKISVSTSDESGQLAHAFNEMSLSLKKMVATISEERGKLATILSSIADGVIMTDTEGNIIIANRAAGVLFNFREENVANKPLIEVVRDQEINEVLKSCLKTAQEQTTQLESGIGKRFLRAIAVPLMNDGALVLFQDLTELRNLQTMRQEFVGNVSHELRTPLAAIKAVVETLQDGAIDDKEAAEDFLNRADSEIDRMTQMIAELTELSRIEVGRAELRLKPVNLNLLIEEVLTRLNPQAERQNVALLAALQADLPIIQADEERIRQAITNLAHNAIKFTRSGGKAAISTKLERDSVVVNVSDNGIGISKEDLLHIFERFYKVDKARSGGGTGLGLAIAKHIVQAHGGNIWAESEEEKGSTFSFSLPLQVSSE